MQNIELLMAALEYLEQMQRMTVAAGEEDITFRIGGDCKPEGLLPLRGSICRIAQCN